GVQTCALPIWARRPLDFPPGADWQYSNTGYVLAGAIVQQIAGQTLMGFLRQRVFAPLRMQRVAQAEDGPLPLSDAQGYTRYGLGPARAAPKEGLGWLFGAESLAMQPGELALWDLSVMNRSLLSAQ